MNKDHNQEIETSSESVIVSKLLLVIEKLELKMSEQTELLSKQSVEIGQLKDEIRRLKGLKEKPKLTASKLPKDNDKNDGASGGNNRGNKSSLKHSNKTSLLTINEVKIISAEDIPTDARKKGYQDFVVQDLLIKPWVTKYRLERWQLANGSIKTAKLPNGLSGKHYGVTLRAYILHQYHHQCVTQPLLFGQLQELGIKISQGQLSQILTKNKDKFHQEKASILSSGLIQASYIQVDDTGARHQGQNGYCTHVGNESFAWFSSTKSKSRINFLEILRQDSQEYYLNLASFAYMKKYKLPLDMIDRLKKYTGNHIPNIEVWQKILKRLNITSPNHIRTSTEAGLIGCVLKNNSFSRNTIIISDDAGQFNVFQHALCWFHAERKIKELIPANELQIQAVDWAKDQIWNIYHLLLDYKKNPNKEFRKEITDKFRIICKTETKYQTLNLILQRLYNNRKELLMVLKRPEIPLHNNLSERDIREYVKRRKISGSTRSDDGRLCRDTFASLKKTAKKHNINFWDYLIDRLSYKNKIPCMGQLITNAY